MTIRVAIFFYYATVLRKGNKCDTFYYGILLVNTWRLMCFHYRFKVEMHTLPDRINIFQNCTFQNKRDSILSKSVKLYVLLSYILAYDICCDISYPLRILLIKFQTSTHCVYYIAKPNIAFLEISLWVYISPV